jgi:hypothetical protein
MEGGYWYEGMVFSTRTNGGGPPAKKESKHLGIMDPEF